MVDRPGSGVNGYIAGACKMVPAGDLRYQAPMMPGWEPPSSLDERLKAALVPPWLYLRYKALREWRRGEAEVRLLPMLVDRRRNAVDIGANKGTYSYFLARLARHVYAFEPNPKMFRILKRGAASNVTASPLALASCCGAAELRVPRGRKGYSNQGGSLSAVKVPDNFAAVAVETRTLDDLALRDIGFIKIDVEGFEEQVLAGARETIERDRPTLLVEIEEAHTHKPIEQSLETILRLGYRGLFFDRTAGALRSLDAFDAERHHRHPESGCYVFNFVFLPVR
jgi:FkbM family methyltransferase